MPTTPADVRAALARLMLATAAGQAQPGALTAETRAQLARLQAAGRPENIGRLIRALEALPDDEAPAPAAGAARLSAEFEAQHPRDGAGRFARARGHAQVALEAARAAAGRLRHPDELHEELRAARAKLKAEVVPAIRAQQPRPARQQALAQLRRSLAQHTAALRRGQRDEQRAARRAVVEELTAAARVVPRQVRSEILAARPGLEAIAAEVLGPRAKAVKADLGGALREFAGAVAGSYRSRFRDAADAVRRADGASEVRAALAESLDDLHAVVAASAAHDLPFAQDDDASDTFTGSIADSYAGVWRRAERAKTVGEARRILAGAGIDVDPGGAAGVEDFLYRRGRADDPSAENALGDHAARQAAALGRALRDYLHGRLQDLAGR